MKTILKQSEEGYRDVEEETEITEEQILGFIKEEVPFKIVNEKKRDITETELAQILIRRTRKKTDAEKLFESVRSFLETGRSTAGQTVQDLFYAGYGALVTTEKKAREWIEQLVESGKLSREKGEELFKKTTENLRERERELEQKSKEILQKRLSDLGIASAADLEQKIQTAVSRATTQMEKEINELKNKLNEMTRKQEQ